MAGLEALKAALIHDGGIEEKVEVNQRHLIDKILARYSQEYTVFRELLQNSNDAGASNVEIIFRTEVKSRSFWQGGNKRVVTSVTYKNNGRPFSEEDWSRLRKIAEGNPDEQKIGFFGVGFYSLFSICEEPFITSGNQSMAFLWKGDMLYTKRGILPPEAVTPWTTFFLVMRDPIDIPDTDQFGRFLATSMAFTANLKAVEVHVDSSCVMHFDKKIAPPRPLAFLRKSYTLTSPNSIFSLESVEVKTVQLDVEIKDGDKDATALRLFARVATAALAVRASNLVKEMERTTKKKPPARTEMHMLWSNHDEYESSTTLRSQNNNIFNDLVPLVGEQGRIFIGFPTYQTTGCTAQLAAHLIPTVERESIDFVDPTLNMWNRELLTMGGLLARILYDDNMEETQRLYSAMQLDATSTLWLEKKAVHAMIGFHFKGSTPSPLVGRILGTYFSQSAVAPVKIISSVGIRPLVDVRLPDAAMMEFLKETPVVPQLAMTSCTDLLNQLEVRGSIRKVDITDLLTELANRPFTEDETIALLKWWLTHRRSHAVSRTDVENLVRAALVREIGMNGKDETIRPLANIRFHAPKHLIPADLPVPDTCLSRTIGNNFQKGELEEGMAFGWQELPFSEWTSFIVTHPLFQSDPAFVEKALGVFSRHYGSLRTNVREQVVAILKSKKCIPTKQGLQLPTDSYFPKVTLFPDLPVLHLEHSKHISDVFLRALGVREHVELQVVFSRINKLNWDQVQLVKYLATCPLQPEEMERLRVTPLFPKELPEGSPPTRDRYKASDLYVPDDKLRAFNLPILEWKGKWKPNTPEAKVLKNLGIRTHIPVDEFTLLVSQATPPMRKEIFKYFIENHKTVYAGRYNALKVKTPFLPVANSDKLALPSECFSDPASAVLGFQILHPDLREEREKFGVREHPRPEALLERLLAHPPDIVAAPAVFGYLAARISDFDVQHFRTLAARKFVPIASSSSQKGNAKSPSAASTTWVEPDTVYFGTPDASAYKDLFKYVDFSLPANNFLRACGTRDEPSPSELTRSLVTSPAAFLETLGHEKYLNALRTVATHFEEIRGNAKLLSAMRAAHWLIGIVASGTGEGEEEGTYQVKLARAVDVYLVDDTVVSQLFKPLGAPADELLENFYAHLGSHWLSTAVKTDERPRGTHTFTPAASALQKLIHERALLLLYDGQSIRTGKDIVGNAEDILQKLKVVQIPEIEVVRTFGKMTRVERTTSCLKYDKGTRAYWLFVVEEYDMFDIARSIGQVILRNSRLKDSLLLSTLLSTSVQNLRRKGFPVDRILKLTDNKMKHAQVIKEKQQLKQETPTSSQNTLDSRESSATSSVDTLEGGSATSPGKKGSPETLNAVQTLAQMFPTADRKYLREQIDAATKTGKSVTDVANAILESGDTYPKQKEGGGGKSAVKEKGDGHRASNEGLFEGLFKSGIRNMVEFAQSAVSPTRGHADDEHGHGHGPHTGPPHTGSHTQPTSPNTDPATPTSTAHLKSHLAQSIASLRATRESGFRATIPRDAPAPPAEVTSAAPSACAILADNDLKFLDLLDGVPLYIDRAASEAAVSILLTTRRDALRRFVAMLQLLATVFEADRRVVHVFWDEAGPTVAFNRGRMLFFNARFYLGLHDFGASGGGATPKGKVLPRIPGEWTVATTQGDGDGDAVGVGDGGVQADAYYYWFLTWCHELAHNQQRRGFSKLTPFFTSFPPPFTQSQHDAVFAFYMSSFAETYMGRLVKVLRRIGVEK
ncbi:uncharacterized protein EV422DRAFT_167088 [Fimicolochytrium jonesii]|uniref:uncharacterized protein n=1 Tax=Fimicolochytrium jonesii TaxID=1396493 RepID=UPI0022FE26BD|nr:uncharacterized protein EV422DRAFT_167088 [Fimicolochytrium jonesii]KAI8818837.1 hypothetical protein EV422DRAFT_167088 [Fimicolochytrium jonesii]